RWIVARAEPAQVWPIVREFWLDMGFSIVRETPEAGILETNWRESRPNVETGGFRGVLNRALPGMFSTGERDRFRARIERGAQPGTTEIFVSHRGLEEVFTSATQDATRWQPRGTGTDRDLEAEMLGRLLVKLGEPSRKASPAAVTVPAGCPGAANAVLQNAGAGPLVVNDGFDRAWRRVGLALDRTGFTVEDRDRTKGVFFVRYIDPEAPAPGTGEGILDKLAFWRPSAKAPQPQYRVVVTDAGGSSSTVAVQNAKGEADTSTTGRRILSLLFDQLK
ncbi:MAG: outer membrane protein assembly factor BamC, partial [Burkholderiales bacterium]|nr:outer membrane protein assembly factor BamC [Burkholderiales bacterium]